MFKKICHNRVIKDCAIQVSLRYALSTRQFSITAPMYRHYHYLVAWGGGAGGSLVILTLSSFDD